MDWASSQWKEGLPSVALQKINELEEKLEKLHKERQQKQIQFECLELTLDKEKRKVEKEKHQTAHLERELQSLAEACKNLESKQQKLQIEIQNKDSRYNNLEAQLIQAKKENCRLQQLEKDIENLKCMKENTKLENKELEEKLKKEQHTIIKQSDAISDLEQTIRSLQEKSSCSDMSIMMDADKENVNALTIGNDNSEPLRKKISEQEKVIRTLKEQLMNISSTKEKMAPANDIFLTPVKSRSASSGTPLKSSISFWDNFGSTPAKTNKIKPHSDSSAFDDSDEKVRNLQLKLKQISQELECQRHNSEAAKNAMEQRLKEKENALKTEIKQQAQTIFDLDKELRELKNKYQQDVVQGNKKLDVVNGQLQKSELSKQQIEKDVKTLELQIGSSNMKLQQKEDELKELSKLKNNLEATVKKLQSEKGEFVQVITALQNQKSAWTEEVKGLKIQLHGSNNLVKEKETLLQNMKKEHDYLSKVNSELQIKIQTVNKDFSVTQLEKSNLEKQLQRLDIDLSSLREKVKTITEERKNICNSLDIEKNKSAKLEHDLTENKKEQIKLQSEIKSNENVIRSLKAESEQLKNSYNVKIKDLEQMLSKSEESNASLKNQVKVCSDNAKAMQDNIQQLEKENSKSTNLLKTKVCELDTLKSEFKNLESQLSSLKNDNDAKNKSIVSLENEIKCLKEQNEVKVKNLEKMLSTSEESNTILKNQVQTYSGDIKIMQDNLKQFEEENNKSIKLMEAKTIELDTLKFESKNLESQLLCIKSDNNAKSECIVSLENEIKHLKEQQEVKIKDLEQILSTSEERNGTLKSQVETFTDNIKVLQGNIEQLEEKNNKSTKLIETKTCELDTLSIEFKNLESQLSSVKSDNNTKSENISSLENEIKCIKEQYEVKIKDLEQMLSVSEETNGTLKSQVEAFTDNIKVLQGNIEQLEEKNNKSTKLIETKTCELDTLSSEFKNLESQLSSVKSDNNTKGENISSLENEIECIKEQYEAKIKDLEQMLSTNEETNTTLKNQVQIHLDNINVLQGNVEQLKEEICKSTKTIEAKAYELDILSSECKNLESQLTSVKSDNTTKSENIIALENGIKCVKEQYEVKVKDLEHMLSTSTESNKSLESKVQKSSESLKVMQGNLKQLEEENNRSTKLLEAKICELDTVKSECNNLESQLLSIKSDNNAKCDSIISFENEIKCLKEQNELKIKELQETFAGTEKENTVLKEEVHAYSNKIKIMLNDVEQFQKEKDETADLIATKTYELGTLKTECETMKSKLCCLQHDNNTKSENIIALDNEIASLKVHSEEQTKKLENELSKYSSKEECLNVKIKQLEGEKLESDNCLSSEKVKTNLLCDSIKMLSTMISSLKSQLSSTTETVDSLNIEIAICKENFKLSMLELGKFLEDLKSENNNLSNQVKSFVEYENGLKAALEKAENETMMISDLFMSETQKVQMFESSIEDLKKNIQNLESDVIAKVGSELILKTEMESLKENYELQLLELRKSVEALKLENDNLSKQVKNISEHESSLKEALAEAENEKIAISDLLALETQKVHMVESNIENLKTVIQNLESDVVDQVGSELILKTEMKCMKKNFEKYILELQLSKESLASEVSTLQHALKEYSNKEALWKKNLEEAELEYHQNINQLLSNEKDFKKKIEVFLIETSSKDECIKSLKSELYLIMKNHKDEKSQLNFHIQNFVTTLSSMQDCVQNIATENEVLKREIHGIRADWQDNQMKKVDDKINRKDLLYSLLNQLNSIENHVEILMENSEAQISSLKTELSETESQVALKFQECSMALQENASLIEKVKFFEEELCKKNLEIEQSMSVTTKQLLVIENLQTLKETLIHENCDLQEKISGLKNKIHNIDLQVMKTGQEIGIFIKEKADLCKNIKLLKEKLHVKELEQEASISLANDQRVIMENLKNVKETLLHAMSELQAKVEELKGTVEDFEKENFILKGEVLNKECKIKVMEEGAEQLQKEKAELSDLITVKESELNTLKVECEALESKIGLLQSDNSMKNEKIIALDHKITSLEDDYELKMSFLSENLSNMQEALNVIEDILPNSKNFCSTQKHQEQSSECMTNNKKSVLSRRKEVTEMCQFVLDSLNFIEKHLTQYQDVKFLPSVILEAESDFSHQVNFDDMKETDVTCFNECVYFSDKQKFVTSLLEELNHQFGDIYAEISSLEDRNISAKDRFKFLVYHQLVDAADFKKMLITLKIMKKMYTAIHKKKLTIQSLQNLWHQLIFSDCQSHDEILFAINSLSGNCVKDNDVNLFFDKCLLVNSYKSMYIASKLRKAFVSTKLKIDAAFCKFEEQTAFYKLYDNVNYHYLHIPIIIKPDFVFMYNISNNCITYSKDTFHCEVESYLKNFDAFSIKKILNNLSASRVPVILNCLYVLHCESNLFTPNHHFINKNLIFHFVNMLTYERKSCISFETVKCFEDFLYSISKSSRCILNQNEVKQLQNLVCFLLQDLIHMTKSHFENEKKIKQNTNVFDELENELGNLKLEIKSKLDEIHTLHISLTNEREKQKVFDKHMEEIKNDLSSTVSQKENWKRKVFELSELCSVLRNIFSGNCSTMQLQSEFATLSDSFCLCKNCLTGENESGNELSHALCTPVNLIHFIAELFTSKNYFEKEIKALSEANSILKKELENKVVTLKQSINDLKEKFNVDYNVQKQSLMNLKTMFTYLDNEYLNLHTLYMESVRAKDELHKALEIKLDELCKCEEKYQELFFESKKFKDDIVLNEQKISQCEKIIVEKTSECQSLASKCIQYESKIEALNNTITPLSLSVKEASNKMSNLEKANKLLNITVENVEEELQNICSEKHNIEENLQEKIGENERLQQEILLWKNKASEGINEITNLELMVQELKNTIQNTTHESAELQNRNSKLQNDILRSTNLVKELKVSLLEKNFCIEKKDSAITQLKEKITASNTEKRDLEMKITNLDIELQEVLATLSDLRENIDKSVKRNDDLESQISVLLIFKNERMEMLQNKEESMLKIEELISENKALKSDLEAFILEKSNLENNIKTLYDKINSNEGELKKTLQLQEIRNHERKNLEKKLNALKEEIRVRDKSNLETSLVIEELLQKVDKLRKEKSESVETAKIKISKLSHENTTLLDEINFLKAQPNIGCTDRTDFASESFCIKSKEDYEKLLIKFINMLTEIIKSMECSLIINENEKTEFLSKLNKWQDSISNSDSYISEIHGKLRSFLKLQLDKQKDLESKLCDLAKFTFKCVTDLNQYCDFSDNKSILDMTVVGEISYLDETLCTDVIVSNTFANCDFNNLMRELQKSYKMLDSHFNSLKSTILKKEMEVKSLQENLAEMKLKGLSTEKQNADYQTLKNKNTLILSNAHSLEKKHNKLLKTYEEVEARNRSLKEEWLEMKGQIKILENKKLEMETRIETLEKEKLNLEAEADEMAKLLQQPTSSDELSDTYKKLAKCHNELIRFKQDNDVLKSALKQYEASLKEQSANLSSY